MFFFLSIFYSWKLCENVVKKNVDEHVMGKVNKLQILILTFVIGGRVIAQLCGYKGLNYTSPTLASALSNLIPAFTFILAIIFRCISLSHQTAKISLPSFKLLQLVFTYHFINLLLTFNHIATGLCKTPILDFITTFRIWKEIFKRIRLFIN